jgi:hypothetical protein
VKGHLGIMTAPMTFVCLQFMKGALPGRILPGFTGERYPALSSESRVRFLRAQEFLHTLTANTRRSESRTEPLHTLQHVGRAGTMESKMPGRFS